MAILDTAALKLKIDNFITTNANNQITGEKVNELLQDISDSLLNKTTDAGLLVNNVGTFAEFETIFAPGLLPLT